MLIKKKCAKSTKRKSQQVPLECVKISSELDSTVANKVLHQACKFRAQKHSNLSVESLVFIFKKIEKIIFV